MLESDLFEYTQTNQPQYIVIEKGVPVPKDGQNRKRSEWSKPDFPFDHMEVGDSFAVRPQIDQPLIVLQNLCSGAANSYCKTQNYPKKFTTRQRGSHVRVWRIM